MSLLSHYEKLFYDVDEGLTAIFDISQVLLHRIGDISAELLHVIFQITINVQATRSISSKMKGTYEVFE